MSTFSVRTQATTHDAHADSTGARFANGTNLNYGQDGGKGGTPGWDFFGYWDVTALLGGTITLATLTVTRVLANAASHVYRIKYQDTATPAVLTVVPAPYSAGYADGTIPTGGDGTTWAVTITTLLQTWRAAYPAATALVLIADWQSSGAKEVKALYAYDTDAAKAPLLYVEYSLPNPEPVFVDNRHRESVFSDGVARY